MPLKQFWIKVKYNKPFVAKTTEEREHIDAVTMVTFVVN